MLPEVAGRDVLVIDDIFDTGHTLLEVLSFLDELRPRSIRTAVLVLKQGKQAVELRPDYVGFEIPDVFVVGYGLDYNDAYRNLPYLAAIEPQDIEAQRRIVRSSQVMAHLRLAIVTPRFWPLVGDDYDASVAAGRIADRAGPRADRRHAAVEADLAASRWRSARCRSFACADRLAAAGARSAGCIRCRAGWRAGRHLDGVLVAGLRARGLCRARLRRGGPASDVLLAGEDDLAWQQTATLGGRIAARCREARTIVAPS